MNNLMKTLPVISMFLAAPSAGWTASQLYPERDFDPCIAASLDMKFENTTQQVRCNRMLGIDLRSTPETWFKALEKRRIRASYDQQERQYRNMRKVNGVVCRSKYEKLCSETGRCYSLLIDALCP